MSNKIVPQTYRSIIDDVVANVRQDFEEFGVQESILATLQSKWESKVMASHVADFEPPPPPPPPPQQAQIQVKAEPMDGFQMPSRLPYVLPALPGPNIGGAPSFNINGTQNLMRLPLPHPIGHMQPLAGYRPPSQPQQQQEQRIPQSDGPSAPPARVPQFDGPSAPPPPATAHPSLPPPAPSPVKSERPTDSEEINSDLDDSDSEADDAVEAEGTVKDIVFCTYDKVQRVKNKWKCVLKDGMIHINGRDYLFSKCTGEFEW